MNNDVRLLGLKQVRRYGGTQGRERMDPHHVGEFAELLTDNPKLQLRPIQVVSDGKHFWLWDGFHRYDGYKQAGRTEIPAEVVRGTQRDARLLSASANTDIVLKRTAADKWRVVELLIKDDEWKEWPDAKIAAHCGVCRQFVAKVREAHLVNVNKIATRTVERNGATFTMEVGPIGKRLGASMPEPKPKPKPEERVAAAAPAEEASPPALVRLIVTLDAALAAKVEAAARKASRNPEAQVVAVLREKYGAS